MPSEIREERHVCESHACQRPGEAIVVTTNRGVVIEPTEYGLVFTPTGVRHGSCPDPYLAAFMDATERGLSDEEARAAMSAAFEKKWKARQGFEDEQTEVELTRGAEAIAQAKD